MLHVGVERLSTGSGRGADAWRSCGDGPVATCWASEGSVPGWLLLLRLELLLWPLLLLRLELLLLRRGPLLLLRRGARRRRWSRGRLLVGSCACHPAQPQKNRKNCCCGHTSSTAARNRNHRRNLIPLANLGFWPTLPSWGRAVLVDAADLLVGKGNLHLKIGVKEDFLSSYGCLPLRLSESGNHLSLRLPYGDGWRICWRRRRWRDVLVAGLRRWRRNLRHGRRRRRGCALPFINRSVLIRQGVACNAKFWLAPELRPCQGDGVARDGVGPGIRLSGLIKNKCFQLAAYSSEVGSGFR